MSTKHALIIIGLLIVAAFIARYVTNNLQGTTTGKNAAVTAPNILQDMCEKNGRIRDTELGECISEGLAQ